eukprot:s308_g33.t1
MECLSASSPGLRPERRSSSDHVLKLPPADASETTGDPAAMARQSLASNFSFADCLVDDGDNDEGEGQDDGALKRVRIHSRPSVADYLEGEAVDEAPGHGKRSGRANDTQRAALAARRASLSSLRRDEDVPSCVGESGGATSLSLPGEILRNVESTDPAAHASPASRSSSPTATPASAVSRGATSEGPEGAGSKSTSALRRRPAELDLEDEGTASSEPSLSGEPTFFRRRAVSDELPQMKRAAATDLPRRHSDVSVSSASSNVAQKIAVYEAFRKVCSPRSSTMSTPSDGPMTAMPANASTLGGCAFGDAILVGYCLVNQAPCGLRAADYAVRSWAAGNHCLCCAAASLVLLTGPSSLLPEHPVRHRACASSLCP